MQVKKLTTGQAAKILGIPRRKLSSWARLSYYPGIPLDKSGTDRQHYQYSERAVIVLKTRIDKAVSERGEAIAREILTTDKWTCVFQRKLGA